jgi:O-acetyl-ADP-ribose deacetylase (regulator of RNase III)
MKIEYRLGDVLTNRDCQYIVQGCNAQGAMGSGIAKTIRDLYPNVYDEYRAVYDVAGLAMGSIVPVVVPAVEYLGEEYPERIILNGITQEFAGRDDVRYVSYDAIANVVELIDSMIDPAIDHDVKVGFPLIGAGLANGDWFVIARLIETLSTKFTPIVYVFTEADMAKVQKVLAGN